MRKIFNIILYYTYKLVYYLMLNKYVILFIKFSNNIINYINLMIYVMLEDYYIIKFRLNEYKDIYLNFGIFKHIFIIFFVITGVIPVILFFVLIFFTFKYLFRYFFLTLDYFIETENKYYLFIRKYTNHFFIIIPDMLKRLYNYIFGGGWTRFFLLKIKDYLIYRWQKFLSSFFRITDNFLLVFIPKKFVQLRGKIEELYPRLMLSYLRLKRKLKAKYWRLKIILKRFIKRYIKLKRFRRSWNKRTKLIKRNYNDFYRKYRFIIRAKYIRAYIYYCWIFKKFIISEVCVVMIEAFFYIAFWDFIALSIYFFRWFYCRLEFFLMTIMVNIANRLIFWYYYLYNILQDFPIYYIWVIRAYIKKFILRLIHDFSFNLTILSIPAIYYNQDWWYVFKLEYYEVDRGYRSFMWYSLKFYAVIQKFFRKLRPTPLKLFIYNKKFDWNIFYLTVYYYYTLTLRRLIQHIYWKYWWKTRFSKEFKEYTVVRKKRPY